MRLMGPYSGCQQGQAPSGSSGENLFPCLFRLLGPPGFRGTARITLTSHLLSHPLSDADPSVLLLEGSLRFHWVPMWIIQGALSKLRSLI